MNKGITLIALVITIIVLLILLGVTISIVTGGGLAGGDYTVKYENKIKEQENCEHDWVTTSTWDYMRETYKQISKCSKCGKEI